MVNLLPAHIRDAYVGAELALAATPVPFSLISNGEYTPKRPSPALRRAKSALFEKASETAPRHGVDVQSFLSGPCGFAASFSAMNAAFGDSFAVGASEAEDADAARAAREAVVRQFVFDDQVHFLRDDADPEFFKPLTGMIDIAADILNLPRGSETAVDGIKFENFLKEIYLDSDTDVALLSGAPSDQPEGWMLTNDMMAAARAAVNAVVGERRLLTHAVFSPMHPGWLDEIDRVHETLSPDGWKGYAVGEPFGPSEYRWRLDDEKVAYPAFEKFLKAGVRNICVHKGLLPEDAEAFMPGAEPFAKVDDVGQAAKDWPDLNFIIYHAGYRTIPGPTEREVDAFETSGRIDWVSDLAEIPEQYGVSNVYADIGAAFAFTVLTHPRLCAGMIGILAKGLGPDHIFWGTDSVWYGSPQWQIEAFRRLKMPADLAKKHGFADFGDEASPFRSGVLGLNAAPFYGVDAADYSKGEKAGKFDQLAEMRARYDAAGGRRTNLAFGYAAPPDDEAGLSDA